MGRLIFVITVSLPFVIFYMLKVYYIEWRGAAYDEQTRYTIARHMVSIMKHNGLIHTQVVGADKLPQDGGYVMFANHQGKYDTLGIIGAHKNPCTILIDEKRSHLIFANQFVRLLKGCRMDKTSIRGQISAISQISKEVREGRRYIVFPEGGYQRNGNKLQDFMPGTFKCAVWAGCPIVPVALVDSFKVFDLRSFSLRPLTTKVIFLDPIAPDEYHGKSTNEIADIVKNRIEAAIGESITL